MKKARKNSEYRSQRNSRAGNEGVATRKVSLERPLHTIIRPSLLLPPEARLRYSLNKRSKLASDGIWGLKEAMSDATLLLTAWDGTSGRDVIHSYNVTLSIYYVVLKSFSFFLKLLAI